MAAQNTLMDVLQRATTDPAYRASLKADPVGVLAAAGVDAPAGVTYTVVENTPNELRCRTDIRVGAGSGGQVTSSTLFCTPGPGGMVTIMPVCIIS